MTKFHIQLIYNVHNIIKLLHFIDVQIVLMEIYVNISFWLIKIGTP